MALADFFRRESMKAARQELDDMLAAARHWRERATTNYDQKQALRHTMYVGHQEAPLEMELRRRYPNTVDNLPKKTLNVVKLVAAESATVFANGVTVKSKNASGEDDPIADMFKKARGKSALAEAERQLQVSQTIYVRAMWDEFRERIRLVSYWPGDLAYVPSPHALGDIRQAMVVMARVASIDEHGLWDVFSRASTDEPWRVERIREDGVRVEVPGLLESGVYPLERLPFVAWHLGEPAGSTVLPLDDDLTSLQTDINVSLSNLSYLFDMESHTPLVYKGQENAPQLWGPGAIWKAREGEDLQSVGLTPKLRELGESVGDSLRQFALSKRLSPGAFTADGSREQASGIALRIENEPQRKMREEQTVFADDMMNDLVPVMTEMTDYYTGSRLEGIEWEWTPAPPPEFEDMAQKQPLVLERLDRGLISEAKAAVVLEEFETVEDAAKAGLSDELERTQDSGTQQDQGGTFQDRLARLTGAQNGV